MGSMAEAYVSEAKREALERRMSEMDIAEADLVERFVLGGGSGGQKINKTSSCVQLRHEPTGTEVRCQRSRSRELNRYYARKELCDRIEEDRLGERSRRRQAAEKIRRQKRRRSRRAKQRMLEAKHRQAAKKRMRQKPGEDD
jgi:protein subunit release factor B